MKTLTARQAALEKELAEVEGHLQTYTLQDLDLETVRVALANLMPLLEDATEAEKAQLLGLLVQRIETARRGCSRAAICGHATRCCEFVLTYGLAPRTQRSSNFVDDTAAGREVAPGGGTGAELGHLTYFKKLQSARAGRRARVPWHGSAGRETLYLQITTSDGTMSP